MPTEPEASKQRRGRSSSTFAVSPKAQRVAARGSVVPAQLSEEEKEDKWHDVTHYDQEPSLPPFQPKRPLGL